MGSRVMHYTITSMLAERLNLSDSSFLLGGIAPDVHKHMNEPKSRSHFFAIGPDGLIVSHHREFKEKYKAYMDDPFFLGYYFHLISDDVWVREIYYKKIKRLPQPEKIKAKAMYYRDFWRLNGLLIDRYSLELKPMPAIEPAVDEIDAKRLPELIRDLQSDFERKDEAKSEDLEILHADEVADVLEHTVRVCLSEH